MKTERRPLSNQKTTPKPLENRGSANPSAEGAGLPGGQPQNYPPKDREGSAWLSTRNPRAIGSFSRPTRLLPAPRSVAQGRHGNHEPILTNLSPYPHGKGTSSLVPLRSPLMTALAAEVRLHPEDDTSGAKAPSSQFPFGTAETVPSRPVPRKNRMPTSRKTREGGHPTCR